MGDNNENDIAGVWMNIKTYLKNIDDIFDYSSTKNKCYNVFVNKKEKVFIVRTANNKIKYIKQQSEISSNEEKIIFIINYDNENKTFKADMVPLKKNMEENEKNINSINNNIWYVINSEDSNGLNENEDYYLSENDILKFGKVKYIVKKIHIQNQESMDNNYKNKNIIFNTNHICKAHKNCDFCGGLMIRLCDCKEFEHFNCINNWINDRFLFKNNKIVESYYFTIFQCKEFISRNCNEEKCEKENCCKQCNTYYPLYFQLDQNENPPKEEEKKEQREIKTFHEINYPEECDYLILEALPHLDRISNSPKIEKDIHVIKLTEKNIAIGSDKNNDVIIHDKTVCKKHSVIKYDKNKEKILLKNISKRAGTLVLIKGKDKNLDLSEKEKYFQVGKTFFSIKLIKKKEIKALIKDLKDDQEQDVKIIELE